jgi:ceramide glucosyltransferase
MLSQKCHPPLSFLVSSCTKIVYMLRFLLIAATLLTSASAAYCVLCMVAAADYIRRRARPFSISVNLPPLSILKPLKGTDPETYESLRSHCLQDYPRYEILFGINDPADAAAEVVKRLQKEFPNCDIRLLHCEKNLGPNGKVSSLAQLAAVAKYDVFVVNDSDIRVKTDYLSTIATELNQRGIGLVTCLYSGVPSGTLGSKLESLGVSTDFIPGALVALLIEGGLRFGLGSTLALHKKDLEAIGGFEVLTTYLADDYQLGRRIAERNLSVELSRAVVETYLPAYDFAGFINHQLRWTRTIRASRPGGYAGLPLTFTLPWAVLALILARGAPWAWAFLATAFALRVAAAIVTGRFVLYDRHLPRLLWLLALRDLVAPLIWIAGLAGRKIVWRGHVFELDQGKLVRRD